jgi:hypothetical protein
MAKQSGTKESYGRLEGMQKGDSVTETAKNALKDVFSGFSF